MSCQKHSICSDPYLIASCEPCLFAVQNVTASLNATATRNATAIVPNTRNTSVTVPDDVKPIVTPRWNRTGNITVFFPVNNVNFTYFKQDPKFMMNLARYVSCACVCVCVRVCVYVWRWCFSWASLSRLHLFHLITLLTEHV